MADPGGVAVPELPAELLAGEEILALVGPEGGFSGAEREMLREHGARRVWLGPYILRTESAAAAIIAAINQYRKRRPAGR